MQELLDSTLQTALCVAGRGRDAAIQVIVDNVAGGHAFPSGASQDRRLWIELKAYAGSQLLYESGGAKGAPVTAGITDPSMWFIRDCDFDAAGKEVHMFWEAADIETNLLSPQLTFDQLDPRYYQSHIYATYPLTDGLTLAQAPDRITMQARLRPIGTDVMEDLDQHGDLDAAGKAAAARIATFNVGKELVWTAATATQTFTDRGIPYSCISDTNLNATADKVPAALHKRCGP